MEILRFLRIYTMKVLGYGIFIGTLATQGIAQTFTIQDIVNAIEQNSIDIIENKAQFESMLAEGKSNLAWQYPLIQTDGNTTNDNGSIGGEFNAILLIKPKLWWVNPLLKESLNSKNQEYLITRKLLRNVNFIGLKRIYLTYIATKEKYKYYLKREENFLNLLSIAKKRLDGGSISHKDLVSFESAYIDSTLDTISVRNELLELQKSIFIILGLDNRSYISNFNSNESNTKKDSTSANRNANAPKTNINNMASNSSNVKKADDKVDRNPLLNIMSLQGYNVPTFNQDNNENANNNSSNINNSNTTNISTNDIIIKDLEFSYISTNINNLEDKLVNSLYTEILDLQIKQHQYMGKYEGRNHWDSLEIGAGVNYSLSSYNPAFQVSVPLPITKKQSYLKAKYMSLESGTLARQAITKKQIAIKAKAYLQELSLQREYINLSEKNTQVKQYLAELNRLGYEAQQVTLFEYITQQNAFVDSQIELVNSQIKYIDLVALLEETLGESFTKID